MKVKELVSLLQRENDEADVAVTVGDVSFFTTVESLHINSIDSSYSPTIEIEIRSPE